MPKGSGSRTKPLFKTTIVIWSKYSGMDVELGQLAQSAASGDAYCSKQSSVLVRRHHQDSEWDGNEFFGDAHPADEAGERGFVIAAEAHSDDRVVEAEFDAEPWFEQASEEDVLQLARCGWKHDYPADAVAHFVADRESNVADLFKYLNLVAYQKNAPGFECSVDRDEALAWIGKNRSQWYPRVLREEQEA